MSDLGMPSQFESEIAPPEELFSRIRTAVAATPAAKTSTRLRVAVALVVAPAVTAAVLLIASQLVYDRPALRIDLRMHPGLELMVGLLLVLGLTLTATAVAISRGERGLGAGVLSLFSVALLVTPIYAMLTLAGPFETAEGTAASLANLSPWGLRCVSMAAAVGLLVLLSFAIALRGAAPAASQLRGAALGAAAGAWAGLSVFIFCPAIELPHLLIGHVLPIAAFTLLGLAAVPRVLRP